jgi:hypothetical protein
MLGPALPGFDAAARSDTFDCAPAPFCPLPDPLAIGFGMYNGRFISSKRTE